MSIITRIASAVLLSGVALFRDDVIPKQKPFSEYNQPEFRVLEKYGPSNLIDLSKAREFMSAKFDVNQNGQITGEEQAKAVSFLAKLYEKRNFIPATPLNIHESRLNLLRALYEMSLDPDDVHRKLIKEIARLRQE